MAIRSKRAWRARPAPRARPALRPLAALIASAFAVSSALAQTASGEDKKPETTLPEVKATAAPDEGFRKEATSAATRTETPLRDIPQFINTVPEALIRSQNATSLQDALRNVPGISYAAGEGGTQANQVFYLRGFPVGGDIFIDGVRDLGEYNRDLFATESVEVLKGPSALMFGRGSTGGLINQTTKAPGLVDREEAALTVGNWRTKRLTADANLSLGDDRAVRLVALAEDSGSLRYPQDVKRLGFSPSVRFGIGNPTDITLSYYYLKTEDVTDYGQPTLPPSVTGGNFEMPPYSPRNYYGFADYDFSHHQTHIATAKIEHRFTKDLSLRNVTRWADYKRQVEATIPNFSATDRFGRPVTTSTPLEDLVVNRNHDGNRTRDNDDGALINQTDLTWKVSAGGIKHTVLTGLELAREKLNRWNYLLDANPALAGTQAPSSQTSFMNPDPSTPLSYTKTPNIRAVAQGDTVATFVQDQMEFSDKWKALLGLRWERYAAEARTESYTTAAALTGPFSRTDRMTSGRAGLIYQPTGTQSYYISAGNSYNPSGELGVYGQNGTNLNPTNDDLAPEKNVGYELGATWDFADGLQLRAAIFRNEKSNARKLDELGATVLTGKRRVDGIEIQLAGYILPNWDVYSGVAFMRGDIVSAPANIQGNVPLGVPDFSGNLWTVYRLAGGWEVGGGLRGTSGFFLSDGNNGEVPGYTLHDLTAALVKPHYEIRLNVTNVGDKTYYVGGYQNTPNRVLPGAPRTYALTLRYTF